MGNYDLDRPSAKSADDGSFDASNYRPYLTAKQLVQVDALKAAGEDLEVRLIDASDSDGFQIIASIASGIGLRMDRELTQGIEYGPAFQEYCASMDWSHG